MDTLISLGTLAAFGWSLYALFFGAAGMPGMTHAVRASTIDRGDGAGNIYLEVAAGVTAFILAGRYFEARAKRRAGAALRALLELAPRTSPCCATASRAAIPVDQLAVGDRFVVRPGEKIATDGVVVEGTLRGRRLACSPASRCRSRSARATRVIGATVNAGGRLVVAGHPGRRRHPARPDGPAGRGGADRQGRRCSGSPTGSPAVFVPVVIALAVATLGCLARHRRRRRRPRSPPRSPC